METPELGFRVRRPGVYGRTTQLETQLLSRSGGEQNDGSARRQTSDQLINVDNCVTVLRMVSDDTNLADDRWHANDKCKTRGCR